MIIGGPTIYRPELEGDGKGGMFIRLVPDLVAMAKAGRVAVITDIGKREDDGWQADQRDPRGSGPT